MNSVPQGTRRNQILRRERRLQKALSSGERSSQLQGAMQHSQYPSMHLEEENLTERPTQANPTLLGHWVPGFHMALLETRKAAEHVTE